MTPASSSIRRTVMSVWKRATLLAVAMPAVAVAHLEAQGPRRPGNGPNEREDPLPLKAERSAKFTATEGTWMSLDVSPDGSTIVFDLLGDLYTMPITGGRATRITKGLAYDAQPRFSPDGETIAFISDRSGGDNLWTMRLDFTDTTQISQGNSTLHLSPEWMPDGEHIVVSRSGGLGGVARLFLYHVDRRAPLPVPVQPEGLKAIGAAPSPDGRYIWYAGRRGDWQYNALFPQYQLYRFDREQGTTLLMTSRYGSGFRPAISPDGNWLVYGSRENTQTGLRKRNLTTGEEEWLVYPVQRDDMESRAPLDVLPGYAFTPDSRAVIASYQGKFWRVPMDGGDPTSIPFEAPVDAAVGPEVKFSYAVDTSAMVTAKQIRNPVASPDGSRLVFTALDRVWVKDMPDGAPRRLTQGTAGEYHAVWSPDGQSVAYVTWEDSSGGQIYRARADGSGQPQRLTNVAALYYNLAWSPDGQRIVATRGAARELKKAPDTFFGPLGGEFVWVPATGGDVTVIAPTGNRDVAHFRNDEPDRIYAYGFRDGLVSFRWDGTDVKRHVLVRGSPAGARTSLEEDEWVALPRRVFPVARDEFMAAGAELEGGGPARPAGLVLIAPSGPRRAVAQIGSHLFALDLPAIGGDPQTVDVSNPRSAPVEVRQLTEVGGEFPSWSADGSQVNWSLGNALFTYDLSRMEAIEDSTVQAARDQVREALRVRGIIDSLKATRQIVDSLTKANTTVPDSLHEKLSGLIADSVAVKADSLLREAELARARADVIRHRADSVRTAGMDSVVADTVLYKPREMRIKVTAPRDMPTGSVVLRGGRVITMKGHEILPDADVVVTNNRIVAVGPRDSITVPDGAQVIDVSGKTVVPGFIDTHYHAQWLVPEIHVKQVWQYLAQLAYGVTTTRDPQTGSTDILSYRDRVETGEMVGPRIYSTGPGVFLAENISSAEHAKTVLKRYSEYYDTKTLKMYMAGNRQQRQWIIQAAKELELMPTTEGGLDFKLDLTHAMDGYSGVEHALPIAPIYSDVVKLFRASQTTNSPTLVVSYGGPFGENYYYTKGGVHDNQKLRRFVPHESIDTRTRRRGPGAGGSPGGAGWFLDEEYVFQKHAEFVKKLVEDSARAGVGSHGQLQGLGYHWELWSMGSGGLSPHDVLRTATIYGAEAIGFGKDLGSIEVGKLADILVLDEDPLADLHNSTSIRYVMKNGRLYEGDTLNEVWPRQRPLPAPSWRALGPSGVRAGIR